MAKPRTLGLIVAVSVAVPLLATIAALPAIFDDEIASPACEPSVIEDIFAIDGDSAVLVQGADVYECETPFVLRRVELRNGALVERWRWTLPRGAWMEHPESDAHGFFAQLLLPDPANDGGSPHIAYFDDQRGYVGRVPGFAAASDGDELLVQADDALTLFDVGVPLDQRWHVSFARDAGWSMLTRSFVVTADRVLRRSDGTELRRLSPHETVGIDVAREERLVARNDGRIGVEALETPIERMAIDVGATALMRPILLGVHGDRWILLVPRPPRSDEADAAFLCAVSRASGAVAWRLDLGSAVPVLRPEWRSPLPRELVVGLERRTSERIVVELVNISLTTGALGWRTVPSGPLTSIEHRGDVAYVSARDRFLARFEDGRLTAAIDDSGDGLAEDAVWITDSGDGLAEDAVWITDGGEWTVLRGASLRFAGSSAGATAPLEARAGAIRYFALPDAALAR